MTEDRTRNWKAGFFAAIALPFLAGQLLGQTRVIAMGQARLVPIDALHFIVATLDVVGFSMFLARRIQLRFGLLNAQLALLALSMITVPINWALRDMDFSMGAFAILTACVTLGGIGIAAAATRVSFLRQRISFAGLIFLPTCLSLTLTLKSFNEAQWTPIRILGALLVAATAFATLAWGRWIEEQLSPWRLVALQAPVLLGEMAILLLMGSRLNVPKAALAAARPDLPDVYVLSGDAIRADAPFLKDPNSNFRQLAATGMWFDRAYAPASTTHRSVHDLLAGEVSPLEKVIGFSMDDPDAGAAVPCELRRLGYLSVQNLGLRSESILHECFDMLYTSDGLFALHGIFGTAVAARQRLALGIARYLPSERQEGFLKALLKVLRNRQDREPLFYYEHVLAAHWPYSGDPPIRDGVCGLTHAQQLKVLDQFAPFAGSADKAPKPAVTPQVKCLYEEEARQWDDHLGRTLKLIRKTNHKAIIVIVSDHGEEFYEHGRSTHGFMTYEENVHVPLLIAGEGIPQCQLHEVVSTAGVLPFAVKGIEQPGRCNDGCDEACLSAFPTRGFVISGLKKSKSIRTQHGAVVIAKRCENPPCVEWMVADDDGKETPATPEALPDDERKRIDAEMRAHPWPHRPSKALATATRDGAAGAAPASAAH